MAAFPRRRIINSRSLCETLEPRQLLSAAFLHRQFGHATPSSTALTTSAVVTPPPVATPIISGTAINAQVGQSFETVVAKIHALPPLAYGYSLKAFINWGDGNGGTLGMLVHDPDGSTDVIATHTYTAAGTDDITVTLAAVPPSGSLAAILVLGTAHSTATVFSPDGGMTLNKTANVDFTANLGMFHTQLSSLQLNAVIDWGDGTTSAGKLIALPSAGLVAGGEYAVVGEHSYSATGSYLVHITVYGQPVPTPGPTPTSTDPASPSFIVLVAHLESVVDVLPPLPTAASAAG